MTNIKLINYFIESSMTLDHYDELDFLHPDVDEIEDLVSESDDFEYDEDEDVVLTYRDAAGADIFKDSDFGHQKRYYDVDKSVITDKGIYLKYWLDREGDDEELCEVFFEWDDICDIELSSDRTFITFYDKDGEAIAVVHSLGICDELLLEDQEMELRYFVSVLSSMAKTYHGEGEGEYNEEARKWLKIIEENVKANGGDYKIPPKTLKAITKDDAEEDTNKKEKEESSTPMYNNDFIRYDLKLTGDNLTEIFSAGRKKIAERFDFSCISKRIAKEKELQKKIEDSGKYHPSPLGTADEIKKKLQSLKENEKLNISLKSLEEAKKKYIDKVYPLFIKASKTNTRILIGLNGYEVSNVPASKIGMAGVYTKPGDVTGDQDFHGLPDEIVEDLKTTANEVLPLWQDYVKANNQAWNTLTSITGNKKPEKQKKIEDILNLSKNQLLTAEKVAEEYENYTKQVKKLKSEVEKLRKEEKMILDKLTSIDPILTAFSLPKEGSLYDKKWIDNVKSAADSRLSIPYLPLIWNGLQNSKVFNWKKAVEEGRPNLFIEAATDEGLEGRMDMLDNFIATMLLAFPIKQVHFTVLENSTINTFVTKLPNNICQIYDASSDREAIRLFTRQLREMYRSGRDNRSIDCCPKEIVVIAGFGKKDRVFSNLMEDLNEIIQNGKRAGIYFAMVLSDDFLNFDWEDTDKNDFEQYFTPYSCILTDKQDKEGNPIPNYRLLTKDVDIVTDEGDKVETLSALIKDYAEKGSSSVPNKVYDLIESGELYKAKPICSLEVQPKKDSGKVVIPIGQTNEGELINLKLDDRDYISCLILGRAGFGKSFTLHTILTNLMLKYDPSSIEVLLMDFKQGVEMNYYKDVPHISSLLVNGADKQVVGEILISIMKEMDKRAELFKMQEVPNIGHYNIKVAKKGLPQMKHIVLLVDECQDLFKVENPNSETNIVTEIARKGRNSGIHMILATQTLTNVGIPRDALAQFSDFLFMNCSEDDVLKCDINNKDLQKRVGTLVNGEVIYCHRGAEFQQGFVFNYYGKQGEYRDKTRENLLSSRFSKPDKKQFYFNSSQIFVLDKDEIKQLVNASKEGLSPVPLGILGKNLSVKGDSLYCRFGNSEGTNLLILGANNLLQSERVLWNAVISLYESNHALGYPSRYYILPNIPEDIETDVVNDHRARLEMLKKLAKRQGVSIVEENDRGDIIERVAATVRSRQLLAEDRNVIKGLDNIYLIIPNQQLFSKKMSKSPKGLSSLDDNIVPMTQENNNNTETVSPATDSLGFEDLALPGSEEMTKAPDFMAIDFGSFDSGSMIANNTNPGKAGRDLDEELRYILEYGPIVKIHVILQSQAPDKIYSGDTMREKEMTLLFNNIVFLKMLQASSMSLPVDSRMIEALSASPKSLRALVYIGGRGERTIVPFDLPKI